ncbi:MAG: CotH kinase family protein [Crocinitomicaceae bacterium]|nr:CotH kinase family protein [Crocinitomicaceae bacterium]
MKNIFFALTILFGSPIASSQNFYDEATIQDIQITFSQSNWDQLLDQAYSSTGDYIMAQSVSINGTVYDSVGVKYKGNSTYSSNQVKNPFHIELDTYKEQDYQGYKDIKLSNVKNDPSFVREVLSYKIGRQYMDASLSNYANVSVNGTLIGLYVNSESVSKVFLKDRFDSKNNTFVKCNPIAGAGPQSGSVLPYLLYLGTDSTTYYPRYEMKSDYGWQELIDLTDTLNNTTVSIDEILDVDRALWMLAFDNVLVNLDSYIGAFAQNYYLYRDDFDKFIPIIWDLNESFGKFSSTGTGNLNSTAQKQQMSHLLNSTSSTYPLISKLLANAQYKRMYLAHIKTMLLENFANNQYFTWGQTMQTTIDAAVQADGNKFYTYANFTSNLTTDIGGGPGPGGQSTPGITNLMNGRSTYLLGLSDFTQTEPTIANISVSNTTPTLNDVLNFTATITDENAVYFGYRTANYLPFVRIHMFDDGAHNDGAAGDGVYGVSATMSTTFLQYYIYAENSGIGKFSPVRAEHEYYTIEITPPPAGNIVINELLASNDITQADQDGEFDDWIELYNNTNSAIDISGYFLSDDPTDLTIFQFPLGASIAANGYLIVWADGDLTQTGLHADFKLSASGETLFLSDAGNTIVDQITFGVQTADISYGRYVNGMGGFISMPATFSSQNTNVLTLEDNLNEAMKIIVYPNPSSGIFTYEISDANTDLSMMVFDMMGNQLLTLENNTSGTIDLSDFSNGIYMVRIQSDSADKILRLVKN